MTARFAIEKSSMQKLTILQPFISYAIGHVRLLPCSKIGSVWHEMEMGITQSTKPRNANRIQKMLTAWQAGEL
jgi:hypothetical protein